MRFLELALSYRVASGEMRFLELALSYRVASGEMHFLELAFLSLICIILTEFCARRISGTKTDYPGTCTNIGKTNEFQLHAFKKKSYEQYYFDP